MKFVTRVLGLLVLGILLAGCSADISAVHAWGKPHTVTLYGCDGRVIGQWHTSGKIQNERQSNGYYFTDDATGRLVMVDGTVVITVDQ